MVCYLCSTRIKRIQENYKKTQKFQESLCCQFSPHMHEFPHDALQGGRTVHLRLTAPVFQFGTQTLTEVTP